MTDLGLQFRFSASQCKGLALYKLNQCICDIYVIFSSCSLASFCVCLPFPRFFDTFAKKNNYSHIKRFNTSIQYLFGRWFIDGEDLRATWEALRSPWELPEIFFALQGWHLRPWFFVQSQVLWEPHCMGWIPEAALLLAIIFHQQVGTGQGCSLCPKSPSVTCI